VFNIDEVIMKLLFDVPLNYCLLYCCCTVVIRILLFSKDRALSFEAHACACNNMRQMAMYFQFYFRIMFRVRQGSVLSPILFALYIDDISNSVSFSKVVILFSMQMIYY